MRVVKKGEKDLVTLGLREVKRRKKDLVTLGLREVKRRQKDLVRNSRIESNKEEEEGTLGRHHLRQRESSQPCGGLRAYTPPLVVQLQGGVMEASDGTREVGRDPLQPETSQLVSESSILVSRSN